MAANILPVDQNKYAVGNALNDYANGDKVTLSGSAQSGAVTYAIGQVVNVLNTGAAKAFVRTDGSAATSDGKSVVLLPNERRDFAMQAAGTVSLLGTASDVVFVMPAKFA